MGWAVLAGADGVVGGDVDLGEVLEGTHADAWSGVLLSQLVRGKRWKREGGMVHEVEHKEAGGYGDDGPRMEGGEAVRDGGHGVLANTPVDVAARVVAVDTAGWTDGWLRLRYRC